MGGSVASGKGTTWVTKTPAPAGPSFWASALLPTKEIVMNTGLNPMCRDQAIIAATG